MIFTLKFCSVSQFCFQLLNFKILNNSIDSKLFSLLLFFLGICALLALTFLENTLMTFFENWFWQSFLRVFSCFVIKKTPGKNDSSFIFWIRKSNRIVLCQRRLIIKIERAKSDQITQNAATEDSICNIWQGVAMITMP